MFLNKTGLNTLLMQLKNIFGSKSILDTCMEARRSNLLEIDYDKELAFDTSFIIGGSAASSVTGTATAGAAIVGNA